MVTDELTVLGFYIKQKKCNTLLLLVGKMQGLYSEIQYNNITEMHERLFDIIGFLFDRAVARALIGGGGGIFIYCDMPD